MKSLLDPNFLLIHKCKQLLPLPVSMSAAMILIINGLKRFVLSNLLLLWNVVVILVGVLLFQRRYGLYAVAVSYAIGASGVSKL